LADAARQLAGACRELASRLARLAALRRERGLVLEAYDPVVPLPREERVVLVRRGLGARFLEAASAPRRRGSREASDEYRESRAPDPPRSHAGRCYKRPRCAPTS